VSAVELRADGGPATAALPPAATPSRATSAGDEYAHLKRLIAGRGLLERQPRRYLAHAAGQVTLLALLIAGISLSRGSWWVLAWALPAAFLFGQTGFLAHDTTRSSGARAGTMSWACCSSISASAPAAAGGRTSTTSTMPSPTGSAPTRTSTEG
jgi:hypothetical protein